MVYLEHFFELNQETKDVIMSMKGAFDGNELGDVVFRSVLNHVPPMFMKISPSTPEANVIAFETPSPVKNVLFRRIA